MNVQLDTTTPNVNFGVKVKRNATVYINRELRLLEEQSCDPFTKEKIKYAKQYLKTIKDTEPGTHKYANIDLVDWHGYKYFVYKRFLTEKDMKKDTPISVTPVSNYLSNYSNIIDLISYLKSEVMPILCRRPDSDFIEKRCPHWDVRNRHMCDYGD